MRVAAAAQDEDIRMVDMGKVLGIDISSGGIGRGPGQQLQKLNEQSGNVIENKGPLWKSGGKSGNVIENT
jgi:hypothetical protein